MLGFPYTMGRVGFCSYFILAVLALSIGSEAVVHDVWSWVDGGFLARGFLQASHLSEIGPSLPAPFQIWNLMDIRSNFDLRLMNSSWSGPAETNIYQKGESMYLQVFASAGPDQELYIQSCYATPSSDPMDKARSALILNKGCVSSKQSVVEFISRQRDSINLLLDTSRLKFSQIYVHCSVVLSSAVTPDTKSCNYNKSKSSWVELDGQTSVCRCCASKCKGPPSYGGPANESKALVSIGPLTLMDEQHEGQSSLSNSSLVASSTGTNQIASGTFPSSLEKGLIVSTGTLSGNPKKKVPYSSPWLSQPVSESVMLVSQGEGRELSFWLPGLLVHVVPDPGLGMVTEIPQQRSSTKLVGTPSSLDTPTEKAHSGTNSEEEHQEAHDWKSLIPDDVSEVYMADSPGLMSDWNLGDDSALEGFHSPVEEPRGDMFMNYKWPQHYDSSNGKVYMGALASPLMEKIPRMPQEKDDDMIMVLKQMEKVLKKVKDEPGNPEYMKKAKLTFSQDSDGSRSLGYEEEERSPSVGEQEVKTSKLEMDWRKVDEKGSSKKLEKDPIQFMLDLMRSLNKTMTDQ